MGPFGHFLKASFTASKKALCGRFPRGSPRAKRRVCARTHPIHLPVRQSVACVPARTLRCRPISSMHELSRSHLAPTAGPARRPQGRWVSNKCTPSATACQAEKLGQGRGVGSLFMEGGRVALASRQCLARIGPHEEVRREAVNPRAGDSGRRLNLPPYCGRGETPVPPCPPSFFTLASPAARQIRPAAPT